MLLHLSARQSSCPMSSRACVAHEPEGKLRGNPLHPVPFFSASCDSKPARISASMLQRQVLTRRDFQGPRRSLAETKLSPLSGFLPCIPVPLLAWKWILASIGPLAGLATQALALKPSRKPCCADTDLYSQMVLVCVHTYLITWST